MVHVSAEFPECISKTKYIVVRPIFHYDSVMDERKLSLRHAPDINNNVSAIRSSFRDVIMF